MQVRALFVLHDEFVSVSPMLLRWAMTSLSLAHAKMRGVGGFCEEGTYRIGLHLAFTPLFADSEADLF
jgi:hypothetical protein